MQHVMNATVESARNHDSASALVDALSRLVKVHAVYPAGNPRLHRLATSSLARLHTLARDGEVSLIREPSEFRVHDSVVRIQGVRRDLVARFRTLNLRRITFCSSTTALDLLALVARLNTNFRHLRQTPPARVDWEGLPDTITVEEMEFQPTSPNAPRATEKTTRDETATTAVPPGLQLTYRRLQRLIQQLRALREQLDSTNPNESRAMDVVRLLLDTLTEIEILVPEQAEELIERTLQRFQAALGRIREQGLPPQVRALLHDVAKKFFPRQAPPAADTIDEKKPATHASSDEIAGEEDEPGSNLHDERHHAFVREIDAFLAQDPPRPSIVLSDERDNVELYLSFLRSEESPSVMQSVTNRLVSIQARDPDHPATKRIRDFLRTKLDDLFDRPEVRPLITSLVPADEVALRVARLDTGSDAQLDAFSRLAEALWPVVLPPLLHSLQDASPDRQQKIFAAVVRRVGRTSVLDAATWLREHLFRAPPWLPWLRALKIPEVLPFFEALFDSPDSRDRRHAWQAAQRFPFRQKAAFWLYATTDPKEMAPDYFHTLLAAEWEGEDASQLFHSLLHTAEQAAFDPDSDRALAAVRALAHADTDQAADALIRVLSERKWGIVPGRPPAIRREARQALVGMRCQKAVYWTLRLKGS